MAPSGAERFLAAVSHAIAILPLFPLNILVTLLYWLVVRRVPPFVAHNARESLNFQITYNIAGIILFAATYFSTKLPGLIHFLTVFIFIAVLVTFGLFYLTVVVVAIIMALLGKWHRYPMTMNFVK